MIHHVMSNPSQPVSEAEFTTIRGQHMSVMGHSPDQDEDTDDHEDDGRSPIDLRISTTLRVKGDNNAVLLKATPADHSEAVAKAVVSAIRQCSDLNGGIPMIDEEGRPRPFNIAVDSGVNVEGSGNVLGNEEHVLRFLRGGGGGGGGDGDGSKRKRDDGDDGEEDSGHRLRRHTRRSSV